jgi:hypothetical protein
MAFVLDGERQRVYSRQSSPIGTGVANLVEWSSQAASLISPRTEATEP